MAAVRASGSGAVPYITSNASWVEAFPVITSMEKLYILPPSKAKGGVMSQSSIASSVLKEICAEPK